MRVFIRFLDDRPQLEVPCDYFSCCEGRLIPVVSGLGEEESFPELVVHVDDTVLYGVLDVEVM